MEYYIGMNVEFKDSSCYIESGAAIGIEGQLRDCKVWNGSVKMGSDVTIGAGTVICIGEEGDTIIGDNVSIGNLCNIGHNVEIGEGSTIGAGTIIAGHTKIGKNVDIKIGCLLRNRINIADGITIGMGSNVIRDLTIANQTYYGNPCENLIIKEEG